MFRKLIKYEWKNNAGLLGMLSLAAVGVAILGTVLLRVLINYSDEIVASNAPSALIFLPLGLLLAFCFLALALYAAAVTILLLYRFYKNKFTDEGYLTFTLPVRPSAIFLSSALVILLWQVISMVLVVTLLGAMLFIGTAQSGFVNREIWEGIRAVSQDFSDIFLGFGREMGSGYGILMILSLIITPIYGIVSNMTWITVGAVLAKKHKILAAIGLAYAGNMVANILSSVVTMFPTILTLSSHNQPVEAYFTISSALQLAIYLGLTVGGYFLSTGLMKHKLNLP
jgi:hypothetical protein